MKYYVYFRRAAVFRGFYLHRWKFGTPLSTDIRITGRFIMFSVITNIYNKKTLMELFTATGKLRMFFLTTRNVRCVHHG
jgi:hypothetical protein